MIKIITCGLLAHRRRLAATALAVILGVSLIAGTLVLTDTISQTFSGLFGTVYKGTAVIVRAKAAFTGIQGSGAQRPLVDASLVGSLRTVKGVAADEGAISGYTRLVGKNGKTLGNPAMGVPTLGANWHQVAALNPFHLVAGHAPQAPGQVAIDAKSARDGHLTVRDTTTVLANGPPQRVKVVGIVGFGAADSPGGASVVFFTTPVAQRLVAAPGKFNGISFTAQPGVSQTQLVHNLQAVLPAGLQAVTGQQAAREARSSIMNGLGFFTTLLIVFAMAALLVGAFMIFNTFSITVCPAHPGERPAPCRGRHPPSGPVRDAG